MNISFKTQFQEAAFLDALSSQQLLSISAVMMTLGCSRSTAKNALMRLAAEGKVKRIPIVGTRVYGWIKEGTVEIVGCSNLTKGKR